MSAAELVTGQPSVSRNRLVLLVYTAAIFVSALLLFSVQPLFTKMVLPRLGGSPAVWSVAMVFFQSLLLAGYVYAHLLMRIKGRLIPILVHLVLLLVAFAALPLAMTADPALDPIAAVLSFYVMADALAAARGRNPDEPRYLNKVTETR